MEIIMKNVIICGGRHYDNRMLVQQTLKTIMNKYGEFVVIHGGATGADTLAGEEATKLGLVVKVYPADWSTYGKRAGYLRNKKMLTDGKADAVVAFNGGRGTAMMKLLAVQAGIPVWDREVIKLN